MTTLPEPISHTVLAIWQAYESRSNHSDSRGIPMSNVGNECERAIWYSLRWVSKPFVPEIEFISRGQRQSIFNTGHSWEERLLNDLESIGCQVERVDPATGQQFRVELADGWLRGKLDGQVLGLSEAPKTLHVVECKSHNSKSFKELIKKKLQLAKPDHYAQCILYMHARSLSRCLYYAVNKDDDARYTERIECDHAFAIRLEAKVKRIVEADKAPPRLFEDPTAKAAYQCGWCPSRPQCHEGEFARKNCRTCLSASFEDGAVVRCALFNKELSYKEQQVGCPSHLYLPSLIPGEQTDASESERWVKYRLKDGSEWVDGAA